MQFHEDDDDDDDDDDEDDDDDDDVVLCNGYVIMHGFSEVDTKYVYGLYIPSLSTSVRPTKMHRLLCDTPKTIHTFY